jgi:hypothetical protein
MIARKFALVTSTIALVSAALLSSIPQTAKADEIIPDTSLVLQDKIAGSTTVSYATNGGVTTPKGVFKIYPNQQFTLQGYAKGTNSGTESITVTLAPTINGTNFDLTHTKVFSFPLVSATAPGVITTNSDSSLWGAAPLCGIVSVQNAHASYVDFKLFRTSPSNAR